jgi:hypothetical protein
MEVSWGQPVDKERGFPVDNRKNQRFSAGLPAQV